MYIRKLDQITSTKLFKRNKSTVTKPHYNMAGWRRANATNHAKFKSKIFNWLPIVLSVIATLISGLTLYFQFFYERNNLTARFVRGEIVGD